MRMSVEILEQVALECLADDYGITGSLVRLSGENVNFRVSTPEGQQYEFKLVDEHMPPAVVELESALLEHVSRAGFSLD